MSQLHGVQFFKSPVSIDIGRVRPRLVSGNFMPILRTLHFFQRPLVVLLKLFLIVQAILIFNDLLGIVLLLAHGLLEETRRIFI